MPGRLITGIFMTGVSSNQAESLNAKASPRGRGAGRPDWARRESRPAAALKSVDREGVGGVCLRAK